MARKNQAHHGGAWKVAYADFVTAMMALFMVLWITSQNVEIREATSKFFQNPYNAFPERYSGVMDNQIAGARTQESRAEPDTEVNQGFLRAVAREFYRLLNVHDTNDENPLDIEITSDGLKITIYDRHKKPVFENKSADFTEWGTFVMQTMAWLIDRYEFHVIVEGHTPTGLDAIREGYGPWELSVDRANAARRLLEYYAVSPEKMKRVTGYGDTDPLPHLPSDSESNQRITVSLSAYPMKNNDSEAYE